MKALVSRRDAPIASSFVTLQSGWAVAGLAVMSFPVSQLPPSQRSDPAGAFSRILERLPVQVLVYMSPKRGNRGDGLADFLRDVTGGMVHKREIRHRFKLLVPAPTAQALGNRLGLARHHLERQGFDVADIPERELRRMVEKVEWADQSHPVSDGMEAVSGPSGAPRAAVSAPRRTHTPLPGNGRSLPPPRRP
jgi:hypothetical protein